MTALTPAFGFEALAPFWRGDCLAGSAPKTPDPDVRWRIGHYILRMWGLFGDWAILT
ncbi:MAG: hypothetical protein ACR65U_00555 [Methylocystis sp.]